MLGNYPVAAMLRAEDAARAKAFYTETLGLSLVMDQPELFAVSAGNDTMIIVYQRAGFGPPQNTVATWEVDDIESVAQDLIDRGISLAHYDIPGLVQDDLGIAELGGALSLWFEDSEGNILSVVQQS